MSENLDQRREGTPPNPRPAGPLKEGQAGLRDCQCDRCVAGCLTTPGWFAPGEAEKAAIALGVPWEEFKKNLIIDFWVSTPADICVWTPRKSTDEEGRPKRSWGSGFLSGRCVFLTPENKCAIHAVKPLECRNTMGCGNEGGVELREDISKMWEAAGNPLIDDAEEEWNAGDEFFFLESDEKEEE